jgi:hypothetical protein
MAIGNGIKGFVLGIAGLAATDLLLSSKEGTKTYATVAQAPAQWLASWLDPAVPLIPDTRKSSSGSGGGSTAGDPCAGLFGPAKILCQQQQGASYSTTYPDPSQLPTTTATVGGSSPYQPT